MAKHTTICAGIDTGKRKLDVALEGSGEQLQVENTSEGHTMLLAWLRRHRVKRVGIEASGGYKQPGVAATRRNRFVGAGCQACPARGHSQILSPPAHNHHKQAPPLAAP